MMLRTIPTQLLVPSVKFEEVSAFLGVGLSTREDFRRPHKKFKSVTEALQEVSNLQIPHLQFYVGSFIEQMSSDAVLRNRLVENDNVMEILLGLLVADNYALNLKALDVLGRCARHRGITQRFTIAKWFLEPLLVIVGDQGRKLPEHLFLAAFPPFTHLVDVCFDVNAKLTFEMVELTKTMDIDKAMESWAGEDSEEREGSRYLRGIPSKPGS
ncbi:hypothetical protein HK102_012744 [Quaeritorhiza haematococci]|nr:hypothetical protein HK102_012744 [Quaeritorhiza haematococci]